MLRKPRKIHFQKVFDAIQQKLQSWSSNLLSYGGRITLVKAVISAMPLHFMQAIKLPIGVIRHIDQMRRNFLWKGNEVCKGINCLVNWETVCTLKENGGLGIIDLAVQNDALLTKWLWELEAKPMGLWGSTLNRLYGITEAAHLTAYADDSSFLKELSGLIPFYSASIWRDNGLVWRWNSSHKFTCASAYHTLHQRGILSSDYKILWKLRAPMKVRIFVWLMRENKILTQEVLQFRGCSVQPACQLCGSTTI
jgi:hypothetical protein